MVEVTGSIPVSSTFSAFGEATGYTLGGIVAGEGSFSVTASGSRAPSGVRRERYVFAVDMATRDRHVLEALQQRLGFGSITDRPARRAAWQPMSQFVVNSFRGHLAATIPFADQFLLPSEKRRQFERWREHLLRDPRARPTGDELSEGRDPVRIPDGTNAAAFLGGFTAAEGSFIGAPGSRRFAFSVGLGAADDGVCEAFHQVLGVGHVRRAPRRQPHFDDEVAYVVGSIPDLVGVVVPFMDCHLPPSHKRVQYSAWRQRLLTYWEERARRRRSCQIPGWAAPRRAKGLCRRHYYEQFRT